VPARGRDEERRPLLGGEMRRLKDRLSKTQSPLWRACERLVWPGLAWPCPAWPPHAGRSPSSTINHALNFRVRETLIYPFLSLIENVFSHSQPASKMVDKLRTLEPRRENGDGDGDVSEAAQGAHLVDVVVRSLVVCFARAHVRP